MIGLKYKLAYKGADSNNRSSSDHARKKRLIVILQELIEQLKREMISSSNITLEKVEIYSFSVKKLQFLTRASCFSNGINYLLWISFSRASFNIFT